LHASAPNRLIAALPTLERRRLLALCELVHLPLEQVLCKPGEITRHVYFPLDSFISLIAEVDAERGLEVGMAGREGMLGVQLVLGVPREPLKALVQGEGSALRIAAEPFRAEFARSPALQQRLHKYVSVLMAQSATAAACLRYHAIGPRLARWLLMTQDRAGASHFTLTHVFVATMLGVRRVGVTKAAGGLQKLGLIDYHRGHLTVLDRPGLLAASCSCYAAGERTYAQALGTRR